MDAYVECPRSSAGVLALGRPDGGTRALDGAQARRWFERLAPDEGSTRLRTMPGRTTYARELDGVPMVLKLTECVPLRARLTESITGRSAARREFEALASLRAAGLRAPQPLLWIRGPRGASLVGMERVEHDEDLAQRLERAGGSERRELLARLARLVGALHGAGFYHRDLYLTHVLLEAGTGELVLLDAGRVRRRRRPRSRWFVKDLAALHHSRPASSRGSELVRFLTLYLAARGTALDRRARRRLVRRVLAKSRRIAAHRPRHEDPATHRPKPRSAGALSA